MERSSFFESEGTDGVFVDFGRFFTAWGGEPVGVALGPFFAEGLGAEDLVERDDTFCSAENSRKRVEFFEEGLDGIEFVGCGQVALIEQDHRCEFDLIDQEVDDVALVGLIDSEFSIAKVIVGLLVFPKVQGIDNGDHSVDGSYFG